MQRTQTRGPNRTTCCFLQIEAQTKLICEIKKSKKETEDELRIILEPLKISGKETAYIYSACYKNSTIPSGISLIFSEKTQNWFKYIQFKGKLCIEVDLKTIKSDQASKVN